MENPVIYCIYNDITEEQYIGSTINYKVRIRNHLKLLRKGKHHSWKLQRAFNKYGESIFDIFILRPTTRETMLSDEQWCIDMLRPEYNICKIAGNTLGLKWTKERKEKQLKYLSNKPKSHIDNLVKALKENKEFIQLSKDRCLKMAEMNKKTIVVIDIEANLEVVFSSIKEASIALGINKNNIQSRLSGIVKSDFQNKYKFKYK